VGISAGLNLGFAYREAVRTATRVQDRLLLGSARIIAQQIQFDDGLLEVAIPPAALELFQSADQDLVYYRIASPSGQLPVRLRRAAAAARGGPARGIPGIQCGGPGPAGARGGLRPAGLRRTRAGAGGDRGGPDPSPATNAW